MRVYFCPFRSSPYKNIIFYLPFKLSPSLISNKNIFALRYHVFFASPGDADSILFMPLTIYQHSCPNRLISTAYTTSSAKKPLFPVFRCTFCFPPYILPVRAIRHTPAIKIDVRPLAHLPICRPQLQPPVSRFQKSYVFPFPRDGVQFTPVPNRFDTKKTQKVTIALFPHFWLTFSIAKPFSASPSFATNRFNSIFLATRWNPRFSHDFPVAMFRFPMYAPPALADYVSVSNFNHTKHFKKKATIWSLCAHTHTHAFAPPKIQKNPQKLLFSILTYIQTHQFNIFLSKKPHFGSDNNLNHRSDPSMSMIPSFFRSTCIFCDVNLSGIPSSKTNCITMFSAPIPST